MQAHLTAASGQTNSARESLSAREFRASNTYCIRIMKAYLKLSTEITASVSTSNVHVSLSAYEARRDVSSAHKSQAQILKSPCSENQVCYAVYLCF